MNKLLCLLLITSGFAANADVIDSRVVTNNNVIFEGTVDDTVLGQDNNLPAWLMTNLGFWSLRVTQDDFACPGFPIAPGAFNDIRVEARHWAGPHGEAAPNPAPPGDIEALICNVNPANGATGSALPVQVASPHGGHWDVLQIRYDPIPAGAGSYISVRIVHAIQDGDDFQVDPPPPHFPDDGILPPLEPLYRPAPIPILSPLGLMVLTVLVLFFTARRTGLS